MSLNIREAEERARRLLKYAEEDAFGPGFLEDKCAADFLALAALYREEKRRSYLLEAQLTVPASERKTREEWELRALYREAVEVLEKAQASMLHEENCVRCDEHGCHTCHTCPGDQSAQAKAIEAVLAKAREALKEGR